MKYGLSEKQLKEIIKVLSSFEEVESAILFGSRAINTFKVASDVDIAIFGKKVDMFFAAKVKDYFEDETYLPYFFDIIAFGSIKSDDLITHINTKGVKVYTKSIC
ncbi:MAG: hypothetical protein COB02_04075 [Candidatus Cloacimonadota bacterium]|nr:MAG: hypothetical protein COB02_04075 [Candidatus Cloacimonadota bacterium]